jgi:hypothetical protein
MKKFITLLLVSATVTSYAQPKLLTQAMVTTKTTIISPDEDEQANSAPTAGGNGEEVRVMRFMGDGETKTNTWLKNDLVKTFSESEMGRTTTIRDNAKKMTTTIMEMMGKKMGFYATDEDQAEMAKRMDSMMKARNQGDQQSLFSSTPPKTEVVYVDESKKIAGYDCKKALIILTRSNGKKDSTLVWYVPDLKLQGVNSTGGALGGFSGFGGASSQIGADGMDKLNGFPMQYERNLNRGRKMTVQVTKLVTDKEVTDKEFEIPKDIDIKPMKDMQNGGGPGRMMMRVGG